MTADVLIRDSVPGDLAAIESIYPEAFPDEDLLPLVRDLLREARMVSSLVGTAGSQVVGHVVFTPCRVAGSSSRLAMLGPLAVAPAWQGQGVGSEIVRSGLQRLEVDGVSQVLVLGDPAYYGRFGFRPESRVMPPYALPPEWVGAWQSKGLGDAATSGRGELELPRPWLKPALWSP